MKTKKQIIADVDEAVKYRKLKTDVINLITSKGQLEKIDINMIDELIFNYRIIDKLKKELLAGGIIVNVRTPEAIPLYQTSSYMSIYNNCLKNILAISRQLGITVSERAKLGLNNISTEIEDGF
jgi:phage terminase small subunit